MRCAQKSKNIERGQRGIGRIEMPCEDHRNRVIDERAEVFEIAAADNHPLISRLVLQDACGAIKSWIPFHDQHNANGPD